MKIGLAFNAVIRSQSSVTGPALDENPWIRGKVVLYLLSFLATVVSMEAVTWVSGDARFIFALMAAAGVGHVVSFLPRWRGARLSFVIYPLALLAIWSMRLDLLAVLSGGALLPLARLLTVIQALASFNLRSLRSLYDTLVLSMAVVLLASEGALSVHYGIFLLIFALVALLFLATAHLVSQAQRSRWSATPGGLGLVFPAIGVVILTFAASIGMFLLIPQSYRVLEAQPLPSRVDLTIGRPVAPTDLTRGDAVPWSQFLPSRDQDAGQNAIAGQNPTGQGAVDVGAGVFARDYPSLGYAGDQGEDVVMYVRSPLASYWRGLVLEEYDGKGWSESDGALNFMADSEGRLIFGDAPALNANTRNYVQSFFLQVPQPDAAFTGYSPGRILLDDPAKEGDLYERAFDNLDRLYTATNYRVVSAIPRLRPEALRQDSADPDYLDGFDTLIASDRVTLLARQIVDGASSQYDMAVRLERFLLNNYEYDLRVQPLPSSGDVVDSFLFERQAGYCSQFATTMAVMARLVDLPARVVTGYLPGQFNSLTGVHAVRLQDSHAWVEIKFQKHGWVPFDPTPRADSPWALDVGYAGATSDLQKVLRGKISDFATLGATAASTGLTALTGTQGVALMMVAPLALLLALLSAFLVWMVRRRNQARLDQALVYSLLRGSSRDQLKRAYRKGLTVLTRKGYPRRQPHQSPEDYLAMLRESGLPVPEAFQQLSRHATDAIYNPRTIDDAALPGVKRLLRDLRVAAKRLRWQA